MYGQPTNPSHTAPKRGLASMEFPATWHITKEEETEYNKGKRETNRKWEMENGI